MFSKVNYEGCAGTMNTAANGSPWEEAPVVILYHKHWGAFTSLIMLMDTNFLFVKTLCTHIDEGRRHIEEAFVDTVASTHICSF